MVYFNLSRSAHSVHPEEIEEERRVAYVGVTRARDHILITAVQHKPSPFLLELTADPHYADYDLKQLRQNRLAKQRELAQLDKQLEAAQVRLAKNRQQLPETAVERPSPSMIEKLLPAYQEQRQQAARQQVEELSAQISRLEQQRTETAVCIGHIENEIETRIKYAPERDKG